MVKYFLKGTDQEVKVGNKISIKVPTKTPYGEGICEVEVLVTQASIEQLCKDGIVERKEISKTPNPTMPYAVEYKPFIKRLARKMNTNFYSAIIFLDVLKDISPYVHNSLLVELMAEEMNKDKTLGDDVFIINFSHGGYIQRINQSIKTDCPRFMNVHDAKRAFNLILPFLNA